MKHMLTHKLLAAACLFALLLNLAPAACTASAFDELGAANNPFTDVAPDAYYAEAVLWAYENGVTAGTTDTTFSPDATCTRGQVVTFLWRAMGKPEPVTQNNPFEDVNSSDYYYKPVLWAYENGITAGDTTSTFGPYGTCTNGHVVTFLWRANGQPTASRESALADGFPEDYYTDAVAWADSSGLLADTGAAFSPVAESPRANIVTYLYRSQAAEATRPEQPEQSEQVELPGQDEQPEQVEPPEQIETPEQTEQPTSAKLANGAEITDDNIRTIIYGLQSKYPEGRKWDNDDSYYSEPVYTVGYGCAGFALICTDAVFGSFPISDVHSDFERVRVGDMLRINHDTHTVVVLEKKADSVVVTEGNYNSSIHWGREISRFELEQGNFSVQSRYPA